MTLRFARRREVDATRLIHRLRPVSLFRTVLKLLPWAVVPLAAGIWLALLVGWGHEGGCGQEASQGLLAKEPRHVSRCQGARYSSTSTLDLDLFPEQRRYHAKGKYVLVNLE